MRILHCIWRMGLGGAERQLVLLVRALHERGIESIVASAFPGDLDEAVAAAGAASVRAAVAHKYDLRVVPRLARLIRGVRPDVVQTWLTQMDIVAGLAAMFERVPWVLSERSSRAAYPSSPLHRARHFVGSRARAIIANSEGGRAHWAALVDARVPIHVIPNIVPQEEIDASPAASVTDGKDVILYVGRLSPEKNLPTLLLALARVLDERDATVVFCGDGAQRASLEELAAGLGIANRVEFRGTVSDVWSQMKSASVLVSVSSFEGNPNVMLEAIAAGTPIVCSDIPAHREILDDTSASLVDGTSPDSIAAGIRRVLDNAEEARARANRARAAVAERSALVVAAEYERIYRDITSTGDNN